MTDASGLILAGATASPPRPRRMLTEYREAEARHDQEWLADFVHQRLSGRYLEPLDVCEGDPPLTQVNSRRSGFAMMASCCLLMETLECFCQGLGTSDGQRGSGLYRSLLARDWVDEELKKTMDAPLYGDIRNGLLHQGETKGGWRLHRLAGEPIIDMDARKLNAYEFFEAMKRTVENYATQIRTRDWEDPLLVAFRHKMNHTIALCEVEE